MAGAMIVCSRAVITKASILATAKALAQELPYRPVSAGRVFRRLGARPHCGICYGPIRGIIAETGLAFTCPAPLASEVEGQPASAAKIAAQ